MKVSKNKIDLTSDSFDQVLGAALKLPLVERAALADHLLASLEEQDQQVIDEAWALEIQRRVRDVEEGRVKLIPGDEVMAQLRSKFKR